MYPTKEQLESKWWHRLSKGLRWIFTLSFFIYCVYWLTYVDSEDIFLAVIISIPPSIIMFFVLQIIYKKVILYTIFGKNPNKSIIERGITTKTYTIIVIVLVSIGIIIALLS